MIKRFRHKGLQRYFETENVEGIIPAHAGKLKLILAMLKNSRIPEDMRKPNLKLHQLRGHFEGFCAVSVSGNWRIVFRFDGQDATDVE
ncbi:MAG: type II toxin-antitoxin system RelE/ParE family toxin [Nitrospinae bacterium]|nr:type II toxin-antitoxin system RelE/ParE family toxin [Nitrospinota bacterium]